MAVAAVTSGCCATARSSASVHRSSTTTSLSRVGLSHGEASPGAATDVTTADSAIRQAARRPHLDVPTLMFVPLLLAPGPDCPATPCWVVHFSVGTPARPGIGGKMYLSTTSNDVPGYVSWRIPQPATPTGRRR